MKSRFSTTKRICAKFFVKSTYERWFHGKNVDFPVKIVIAFYSTWKVDFTKCLLMVWRRVGNTVHESSSSFEKHSFQQIVEKLFTYLSSERKSFSKMIFIYLQTLRSWMKEGWMVQFPSQELRNLFSRHHHLGFLGNIAAFAGLQRL